MAPKVDKGTIVILDIGKNVADPEKNDKISFFESARDCAKRFIEHKIISQKKDQLGVILLGSKKTDNVLAAQTEGTCRHIEMLADLQSPNWQMIRDLPENPSKSTGKWFDALLVAAEHFKFGMTSNILNKQIIIISNFKAPSDVDEENVKLAIHGFQEEGLEVSVLGPDIYDDKNCIEDIDVVRQFVEATNGATATLDYTLGFHLLFHRKKCVNPTPWNVDLSVGPNIKIPVSSYTRIKDEPVTKKWIKAVRDPVTQTVSATESIEKKKIFFNTENQTEIKINDAEKGEKVIKGYVYGGQVIPFSDCDKSMLYDAGPKSLIVYGFTKSSNITYQNLNGDGLSYVFGRKGDIKAEHAIRCLVLCLLELDLVGIVRRVYNNGNAPKMFILMPVVDENNLCLSMAGICFKEEIKNMSFPVTNSKKFDCTNEQVDAFKELIKAMELSKAFDEQKVDCTDAFPILKMCSPSAQYILDCIAFRAMNPDKPLPPPREEIIRLLNVLPIIEERAREPLEKIKKLFVLNKVEIKKRRQKTEQPMDVDQTHQQSTSTSTDGTMEDIPKVKLNIYKTPDILRVGTVNPIQDYEYLKQKINVNELLCQLAESIENIFFCNLDDNFTKGLEAMVLFRTECVKSEPSHYNKWLKKFKTIHTDRKNKNIIEAINDNKFDYILASENSLSDIVSQVSEESQLYENDTVPNLTEVSISSQVNDLFDNM